MILAVACLFLAALPAHSAPQKPSIDPATAEAVLARDPRSLPKSEPGRWTSWGPKEAVPEALQAPFGAAMRAYAQQDYTAAMAVLYAVLERERDYPAALYQLGLCYFRVKRYGDCAALFERFVAVAPQEIGATQALGHCYYSLGDFARAKEHYLQVLAKQPESVEALRGLALSHMRLGEPERARELLQRVLELRATHAEAHAWLAQLLYEQDQLEEALVHARRSQELEPFEPKAWFVAGKVLGELGRAEEAAKAQARFDELSRASQELRQLEGLLLHDPRQTAVWMRVIEVQRSLGNAAAVQEAVARAVQLSPSDWHVRGLALHALRSVGDAPAARQAAAALEQVAGEEREAWQLLADYYKSVGDTQGFLRSAERVKRLGG